MLAPSPHNELNLSLLKAHFDEKKMQSELDIMKHSKSECVQRIAVQLFVTEPQCPVLSPL